MDYAGLENEIVSRLQAVLSTTPYAVAINPLPENQSEFSKATDFERVTVGYDSSDFAHEVNTELIGQPETIKVCLTIQSFSLRGDSNSIGIYGLKTLIKNILLGWTPTDCDMPMKMKYFGPPNLDPAFIDNMWYFELHMLTRTIEVQEFDPTPTNIVSNFTSSTNSVTVSQPPPLITLNP